MIATNIIVFYLVGYMAIQKLDIVRERMIYRKEMKRHKNHNKKRR